jgi:branched-chain amino acid transport system permease protein
MDPTIALFLVQDGIINGAIYALAGIALVLVFSVTRVILVPQGEFVAFATLTLAALEEGTIPATPWLLLAMGVLAALVALYDARRQLSVVRMARILVPYVGGPLGLVGATYLLAPLGLGLAGRICLTIALITPMGPLMYRIAFEPIANASVLILLIAAFGVHMCLTGLGLGFFGPEGVGTAPLVDGMVMLGDLVISGQSIVVVATTVVLLIAFALFFERTLAGRAFRACSSNRLGARLVGIPTALAGRAAFTVAALVGAISGILVGPLMTVYYDSGFLIGLKAFIAAIIGGLVYYPLTVAAALGVGLLEAFSSFWTSTYKEVIVFTIIIPFLAWRSLTTRHLAD